MIQFKCDNCGKTTHMNPPHKPVLDEDGKPKMVRREVEHSNGQSAVTLVPEVEYLEEKCFIVSVAVGDFRVQRDFCEECLGKIKPKLKEVIDLLKEVKPQ